MEMEAEERRPDDKISVFFILKSYFTANATFRGETPYSAICVFKIKMRFEHG